MTTKESADDRTERRHNGSGRQRSGDDRFTHLFENIQDAVVEFEIVEETPIVRAVNPAFVDSFGYETAEIVGQSLNEFIVPDAYADEAQTFDDRTDDGKDNRAVVRRETADGIRRFLYRSIPYDGESYGRSGFAVYTDITDRTRREHRLQVLHRILRHNLRNDVTVIRGVAGEIARATADGELEDAAEQIQRRADQLAHLGSEAARVDKILGQAGDRSVPIDIVELCERVVSKYRESSDAEIDLEIPESLTVTTTTYLDVALEQLVENAIEHNDAETPRVELTAERVDDWVELRVADDGPSIPAGEKQVITSDELTDGDPQSQLSHGSGLGLRLVQWITDAVGGTVEIGQSDMGGNLVRLRLKHTGA